MTKPRLRVVHEPLTMTWAEVAETAFRRGEQWLRDNIGKLKGFPAPDPALNLFSAAQVRGWVANRFGDRDAAEFDHEQKALEAAAHGIGTRSASRAQGRR